MISISTTNTQNQYCQQAHVVRKAIGFAGRKSTLHLKGSGYNYNSGARYATLTVTSIEDLDKFICELNILRNEMQIKSIEWDQEHPS